jgi:hypothetical protein
MNGSSKILTVSYGTFSCTLEGFDDPLGTMRELAEYFRDLAADDRYFGAEPPTPDVEMLQNIAQREVRQKVEARTSPTGISLTKVEEAPAPRAAAPVDAPAASTPESGSGPLTFDDDFLMADEPEDILAVDPDAAPGEDGPAESVAEKLRRIRAVVSKRPGEGPGNSFNQSKAQDAVEKRDRALSETIRQIQDDLSDEDGVQSAVGEAPSTSEANAEVDVVAEDADAVDIHSEGDTAAEAGAIAEDETKAIQTPDLAEKPARAAPDVDAVVNRSPSYILATEGTEEDEEDADEAAMSQLLEKVSERVETDAPKPSNPLNEENTDADVGRLLEETDNKLNEDGVVRRRQVISQMRAAVAATKADRAVTRLISFEDQEEVEKKAYRNDLSDAVSETGPLPDSSSSRKPSGPPLVLVSSQRVDESETQEAEDEDTSEGFTRFIETSGAKGIDELLEATAAYTVFSQGKESFSRPEIMKRVAMADPALSMSREDGLRSFGQLLRQGKFQKLERGQFTIDSNTRFNPQKRIAGE